MCPCAIKGEVYDPGSKTWKTTRMVNVGLGNAPLVELKGVGRFSLHDIWVAEGREQTKADQEAPDRALIQGAFGDASPDDLVALGEGIAGSIAQLNRTVELWSRLAENAEYLSVDETLKMLSEVLHAIETYAPVAAAAASDEEDGTEQEGGASAGGAAVPAQALSGQITNRNDVVKAIDKICEYYAANEPSSPIPLLLRRAQRLVPKSFFEILADIAPDGVSQVEILSGSTASAGAASAGSSSSDDGWS
jgi:type VI secretion system protein ImpA